LVHFSLAVVRFFPSPLFPVKAALAAPSVDSLRQEKLMKISTMLRYVALPLAMLVLPAISFAQQTFKCEANNNNRKYCGTYRHGEVRMQQQISGSPCIEGQTWGVDRQGLWVERGCRAIFVVGRFGGPGGPGDGWWDPEPGGTWPPRDDWHGGNWGRGGACFYRDRNFGGNYFCLRRGEVRDELGDLGDDISSIRVFGGARVSVFNDRNFRGGSGRTGSDIPDLRQWRFHSDHTWNNRISSVRVQ
jgi:Protein of unknown function (DUF3011)/Peptidase inhibitor family I36